MAVEKGQSSTGQFDASSLHAFQDGASSDPKAASGQGVTLNIPGLTLDSSTADGSFSKLPGDLRGDLGRNFYQHAIPVSLPSRQGEGGAGFVWASLEAGSSDQSGREPTARTLAEVNAHIGLRNGGSLDLGPLPDNAAIASENSITTIYLPGGGVTIKKGDADASPLSVPEGKRARITLLPSRGHAPSTVTITAGGKSYPLTVPPGFRAVVNVIEPAAHRPPAPAAIDARRVVVADTQAAAESAVIGEQVARGDAQPAAQTVAAKPDGEKPEIDLDGVLNFDLLHTNRSAAGLSSGYGTGGPVIANNLGRPPGETIFTNNIDQSSFFRITGKWPVGPVTFAGSAQFYLDPAFLTVTANDQALESQNGKLPKDRPAGGDSAVTHELPNGEAFLSASYSRYTVSVGRLSGPGRLFFNSSIPGGSNGDSMFANATSLGPAAGFTPLTIWDNAGRVERRDGQSYWSLTYARGGKNSAIQPGGSAFGVNAGDEFPEIRWGGASGHDYTLGRIGYNVTYLHATDAVTVGPIASGVPNGFPPTSLAGTYGNTELFGIGVMDTFDADHSGIGGPRGGGGTFDGIDGKGKPHPSQGHGFKLFSVVSFDNVTDSQDLMAPGGIAHGGVTLAMTTPTVPRTVFSEAGGAVLRYGPVELRGEFDAAQSRSDSPKGVGRAWEGSLQGTYYPRDNIGITLGANISDAKGNLAPATGSAQGKAVWLGVKWVWGKQFRGT
jgi:hypothetical protein